jgi:hypothetical protein
VQQSGGVKAFFGRPLGKGLLAVVALLTLVGSFLYLGPLLAVPTFLLFALALPIYMGWKRIRDLAIVGLVVLLVAAPIASALDAQQIRLTSPLAVSDPTFPYGNGSSVITNAGVNPFLGPVGGVYNFSFQLNPSAVPSNSSGLLWVTLYISTCPGATGNSSPYCSSGYPYLQLNRTLPGNLTGPVVEGFNVTLGDGAQIWWWQASTAYYANNSSSQLVNIFLDVPSYGSQEGPVTGPFVATFEIVLVPILEALLLYTGTVFFFALLIYMYFRGRRQRRAAQGPPGGTLPASTSDASGATPAGPPVPTEQKCPNCRALVYPNETNCWKCGASLKAPATPPASNAPLTSGKSP